MHRVLPALTDLEFFWGKGTQSRTACVSWTGGQEAVLEIQLPSLRREQIRTCTILRGLTRMPFILHMLHPRGNGAACG